MNFTDRYLQSLKPKENMYDVREGKGFMVRVLPSGTKTFYFVFKLHTKRYFYRIGLYDKTIGLTLSEAREKYLAAALLVSKGINPIEAERTSVPAEEKVTTVASLVKTYCSSLQGIKSDRHSAETLRLLTQNLVPIIGSRDITEIRRRDAITLIESIANRGSGAALGVLKAARAMYSYALQRELVEMNPFAGIVAAVPHIAPSARERNLSDDEIVTIWHAILASAHSESVKRALLLILVTAQRPGEVAGMHRSEITIGVGKKFCQTCRRCGWWTIPGERTKNRKEHKVFLTPLALKIIGDQDGLIFPALSADGPVRVRSLSQAVNTSGKTQENSADTSSMSHFGIAHWTPHDLRRTAATKLSELECTDQIIDAILNHSKQGIIGVYNRYTYEKEKLEWLSKWTEQLELLIDTREHNQEPKDYVDARALAKLVWEMPLTSLAKQLGISDVAIKKRCSKLGIETPPQGYWLDRRRRSSTKQNPQ